MDRLDLERRLGALASLAEPVPLALYRYLAGREQGLGRDVSGQATLVEVGNGRAPSP